MNNSNDTSFYAWLVFEPMTQTVSILRGSFVPLSPLHNETSDFPMWEWKNISSELQSMTWRSGLRLGAPFTAWDGANLFAGKYMNGSYSKQAVYSGLHDPSYAYDSNFGHSESLHWITMQSLIYKVDGSTLIADVGFDSSSIGQSDLLIIGIPDTLADAALASLRHIRSMAFGSTREGLYPWTIALALAPSSHYQTFPSRHSHLRGSRLWAQPTERPFSFTINSMLRVSWRINGIAL